jgi:excisionase family DNA binding protein
MNERIYLVAEVAEMLQVTDKAVRAWIARGELIAFRTGREWRVRDRDIEGFIQAHLSRGEHDGTQACERETTT